MAGRLHLRLRPAAERKVRGGHPWVYSESIRGQNREGSPGELAVIFDRNDRFLAAGLYDPGSPIRVRIVHRGKPVPIDENWWRQRLREAAAKRAGILDARTNGCRLIHGENDGWPALVLDRYGGTLVLKLYSAAWFPHIEMAARLIESEIPAARLVLRLSRNITHPGGLRDGSMLFGGAPSGPVTFLETGIRFEADVVKGQKTGFFLDQRKNRREVEPLAAGRDVLNAFSFSGGFSLYAARGGARSVTDVDLSQHALVSSRRHFALNPDAAIQRCRHEAIQADVFEWLKGQTEARFGLAVLDPPSLARREQERAGAIQAYRVLNAAGIRVLKPGGILMAASCSAHVARDEFYGAVLAAARSSGRRFEELKRTGHPADHPAAFPEAEYLKAIYLQFG